MKQYHYQEPSSISKELKKQFRLYQVERIVYAVLMALMGVLFIFVPAQSGDVLCMVAGIFLVVAGVVSMGVYFARTVLFGGVSLVFGMLLTLTGVLCLIHPAIVQSLLTVLIGLIVIVDGTGTFVNSIECAKVRIRGWFWLMLLALLTISLGAFVLFSDFSTVMYIAGCALIVDALCKVIATLIFGNRIHSAHKAIHNLRNTFYENNDTVEDVSYEEVK